VASAEEIDARLAAVIEDLERLLASYAWGKYVHDGMTLAIVGRPNVGKSSLFNALLGTDRAIVTDIPGTTRDTVSESFALEGVPVRLVDTAGIRDSQDLVERLGIERTERAMADADITLVVLDLGEPLSDADRGLLARAERQGWRVVVGNKSDLPRRLEPGVEEIAVSAQTGAGIAELKRLLVERIAPGGAAAPQSALITSARHEALLREAREAAMKARQANAAGLPHELLLLDCYAALQPLDALTGATTADDILNRIFSTFCIGK
jgi:tRNA modification GTPase